MDGMGSDRKDVLKPVFSYIWSNYSDLTRPHPKWWFSKGNPLISGKSRLVKYYNLPNTWDKLASVQKNCFRRISTINSMLHHTSSYSSAYSKPKTDSWAIVLEAWIINFKCSSVLLWSLKYITNSWNYFTKKSYFKIFPKNPDPSIQWLFWGPIHPCYTGLFTLPLEGPRILRIF